MMQEFDLIQRSRRLRGNPVLRELVRETRVSPSALIYPLFIREGQRVREPIPSWKGSTGILRIPCYGSWKRSKRLA